MDGKGFAESAPALQGSAPKAGDILPQLVNTPEDQQMKKSLGAFSLGMMTFSSMLGSGWLFAAYYSSQTAGPASIISWVIGGFFTILTALVFIELAIAIPVSGGLLRWPQQAAGPFVGALGSWIYFGLIAVGGATEVAGIVQYASRWWPQLFDPGTGELTWTGIGACMAGIALFTVVNFVAIRYIAYLNNVISAAKWVIPFLTIGLLLASGFHSSNFTAHGGFAPYGFSSIVAVVTTGGIVYAFGGVNTAQTVAGEVRNPRRDQVRGSFFGIVSAFMVYILLQVTFIGVLPSGALAHGGWHGIDFSSPLADLAVLVNLGWLATVLTVDAVVSPAGAALIGTASLGRSVWGMAQNRALPRYFRGVNSGGVPVRALSFMMTVEILALLVFRSWHGIVAILGSFFAFGYATASIALGILLAVFGDRWKRWFPGIRWVSLGNFVVAALIMYWTGWQNNRIALGFLAAFAVIYVILVRADPGHHTVESFRVGVWMWIWAAVTLALGFVGAREFGGHDWVPEPWDSVLVGVIAVAAYLWGVHLGRSWVGRHGLTGTPLLEATEAAPPLRNVFDQPQIQGLE